MRCAVGSDELAMFPDAISASCSFTKTKVCPLQQLYREGQWQRAPRCTCRLWVSNVLSPQAGLLGLCDKAPCFAPQHHVAFDPWQAPQLHMGCDHLRGLSLSLDSSFPRLGLLCSLPLPQLRMCPAPQPAVLPQAPPCLPHEDTVRTITLSVSQSRPSATRQLLILSSLRFCSPCPSRVCVPFLSFIYLKCQAREGKREHCLPSYIHLFAPQMPATANK